MFIFETRDPEVQFVCSRCGSKDWHLSMDFMEACDSPQPEMIIRCAHCGQELKGFRDKP